VRIAHVSPYDPDEPGVVQDHVRAVTEWLAAQGHEVVVAAPSADREILREGRRRLAALAAGDPDALAGTPGKPLRIALGPALPLRGRAAIAVPAAAAAGAGLLATHGGLDIVHVHEPGLPVTPYRRARQGRALCVATFHTALSVALGPARTRDRRFGFADALVAGSPAVLDALDAHAGEGDWHLIPTGVELTDERSQPLVPLRAIVETTAGNRSSVRAVTRALGPVRAEVVLVSTRARPRPLSGTRVARASTPLARQLLLRGAAILVAARDGSPRLALEALAAGVAIAAPDDSPAAALITTGESGLTFAGSAPELASAVALRLLEDAELRGRLARAGREIAAAQAFPVVAAQLEALYRELVARRPPAREDANGETHVDGPSVLADLHMHTHHSGDCATPVDDLLDEAIERGLSVIAVTDHNTIAGGLEAARRVQERDLDLQVIVGSEIMTDGQGEVIGLFLSEEVPKGLTFAETVSRIHAQGGLVYVPHPFDRMHSIPSPETLRRHVDQIDVLETANGRLYFERDNAESERFAERWNLLRGAGSDAHVSEGLATAVLRLPPFDGPDGLLASLRTAEIERRPRNLLYLQGLKWVRQLGRSGDTDG
jgi:predicted metal-dependent phosphoesterase TrpH/glycosyltransferase involved in cell wall biosynthesis